MKRRGRPSRAWVLAGMLLATGTSLADYEKGLSCLEQHRLACAQHQFRLGAEDGDAASQLSLAVFLEIGIEGPADPAQALAHYVRAAEGGLEEAALNAGVIHAIGNGVRQDYAQARLWFERFRSMGRKRVARLDGPSHSEALPRRVPQWFRRYLRPYAAAMDDWPRDVLAMLESVEDARAYLLASSTVFSRMLRFPQQARRRDQGGTVILRFRPRDGTVAVDVDGASEPLLEEVLSKGKRAFGFAPMPKGMEAFGGEITITVQFVLVD